ncbi:hypothetical protein pb186bvf_002176 [Paramecium bursaria]
MYTLINELWSSQVNREFKYFNIPNTIIISPGFKICWFLSKENKILKKGQKKSNIENILTYFINRDAIFITVNMPYSISQIQNFMNLSDQLEHYKLYSHLIENPIIVQEKISDLKLVCLTWNKNFSVLQECDDQFTVSKQEIKLSPHFRVAIEKLTQELEQRIRLIHYQRGNLKQMRIIYGLSDKPYFLWLTNIVFEKEQLVSEYELKLIIMANEQNEEPTRRSAKKHLRCISNQENESSAIINSLNLGKLSSRKSVLASNRSNSNNSQFRIVHMDDGQKIKVTQRGSITQRTENCDDGEAKRRRLITKPVLNLKLRLKELQLKI